MAALHLEERCQMYRAAKETQEPKQVAQWKQSYPLEVDMEEVLVDCTRSEEATENKLAGLTLMIPDLAQ